MWAYVMYMSWIYMLETCLCFDYRLRACVCLDLQFEDLCMDNDYRYCIVI